MQSANIPNHHSATPDFTSVHANEIFRYATAAHLMANYPHTLKGEHLLVVALHYTIQQLVAKRPPGTYDDKRMSRSIGDTARKWAEANRFDFKEFGRWYTRQRYPAQFALRNSAAFSLASFEAMVVEAGWLPVGQAAAGLSAVNMNPQVNWGAMGTSSAMAAPQQTPFAPQQAPLASQQTFLTPQQILSAARMDLQASLIANGTSTTLPAPPFVANTGGFGTSKPSPRGKPVTNFVDNNDWRATGNTSSVTSAPRWVKQVAGILLEKPYKPFFGWHKHSDCLIIAKRDWSLLLAEAETHPIPLLPHLAQLDDHVWKWLMHMGKQIEVLGRLEKEHFYTKVSTAMTYAELYEWKERIYVHVRERKAFQALDLQSGDDKEVWVVELFKVIRMMLELGPVVEDVLSWLQS